MNIIKNILITLFAVIALPLAQADEKKIPPVKYPLETCIVSDEKLGEMGKPLYMEYNGKVYGFCCKACTKDFVKDPQKFEKKLNKITTKKK